MNELALAWDRIVSAPRKLVGMDPPREHLGRKITGSRLLEPDPLERAVQEWDEIEAAAAGLARDAA